MKDNEYKCAVCEVIITSPVLIDSVNRAAGIICDGCLTALPVIDMDCLLDDDLDTMKTGKWVQ